MISAIVLAAGTSTRMGAKNKLALPFGKSTFIETVVDQLLASNVDEVIVVLGYEREKISNRLYTREVLFALNTDYQIGMTSSIKTGISAASENSNGYLICLSDMPFLTTVDYNKMINSISGNKEILLPFHHNQKGNPVFFSNDFKNDLLNHHEPEGCRGVVADNKSYVKKINFDNNHILKDVDTEDDFKEIF